MAGSPQPAAPTVSATTEACLLADQRQAIDALRRYVADHGQLPSSKQPPDELPTLWTIRQLFGSWNGYMTAAGFTPRPYRAWNHTDTIAAIQRWAQSHDGKPPSRAQWPRPSRIHPSEWQVRRLFGTWSAAIRQAGLSPQTGRRGHWTDEAILDALRRWADLHGVPSSAGWSKGAPGRPTHALVTRAFGSWDAALRAAGLQRPPAGRWSAEEIIDAIQSWTQTHQRPPRALDWEYAAPDHPNRVHVWKHFGSWNAALLAAGLPVGTPADHPVTDTTAPPPSSTPPPGRTGKAADGGHSVPVLEPHDAGRVLM